MKATLLVLLATGSFVFATTWAAPPMTKEDLIGDWESVFDIGGRDVEFYRMEIREEPADSYLIRMDDRGASPLIARLVSSEVRAGNVTLRFAGEPSGADRIVRTFTIQGYVGASDATTATITGKVISHRASYWPEVEFAAIFKKGSWTRELDATSKKAEQLLSDRRAKKPQA
jgi:hypothetical protein